MYERGVDRGEPARRSSARRSTAFVERIAALRVARGDRLHLVSPERAADGAAAAPGGRAAHQRDQRRLSRRACSTCACATCPTTCTKSSAALALARAAGYTLPPHDEGRLAMRDRRAQSRRAPRGRTSSCTRARRCPRARGRPMPTAISCARSRRAASASSSPAARPSARCARTWPDGAATDLAGADVVRRARARDRGRGRDRRRKHRRGARRGGGRDAGRLAVPADDTGRALPAVDGGAPCCWAIRTSRCRGCRARTCPVPGQPCLSVVTVDDVLSALASVRRAAPAARR